MFSRIAVEQEARRKRLSGGQDQEYGEDNGPAAGPEAAQEAKDRSSKYLEPGEIEMTPTTLKNIYDTIEK